jgi:folate-binding protein YgfZ
VTGYDALVERCAWSALDRDVCLVAGPDAIGYLQGQVSQDVEALAVGTSAWSLVLQPQGRIDAWARISRVADDAAVLDVDAGFGPALVARLARFKLRVKADIEPLPWRCVAVRGPAAGEVMSAPPPAPLPSAPPPAPLTSAPPPAPLPAGEGIVAAAAWPLVGGWDRLGPDPTPPAGVTAADAAAFEVRRIEAGLPRMGAELTERTIPAEAGIVEVSVSFTKGCYTGQELVARIDSRGGHVPRHLRGVRLEAGAPVPAPGDELEVAGKPVGAITSAARHPAGHVVALAYVARAVVPPADGTCAGSPALIGAVPPG